jgi:ribosomal protein L29
MDKKLIKGMSAEELGATVDGTRRALFSLRVNRHAQHIKDYSQFTKMRRTIARALTEMSKKESQHGK